MAAKSYKAISIPVELCEEIESIIKSRRFGYTSVAEFVKDAIRDKIREFRARTPTTGPSCAECTTLQSEGKGTTPALKGGRA